MYRRRIRYPSCIGVAEGVGEEEGGGLRALDDYAASEELVGGRIEC